MQFQRPRTTRIFRSCSFFALLMIVLAALPAGQSVQAISPNQEATAALATTQRIPNDYLTAPAKGDPYDIAIKYLRANQAKYNLTSDDITDLEVKDRYVSQQTGVTHMYIRQRHLGIEVYNADYMVNVNKDGRILTVAVDYVADLAAAVNTKAPKLSAADAVQSAAKALNVALTGVLQPTKQVGGADQAVEFAGDNLSRDAINVRLQYQPVASGAVRLTWAMPINLANSDDWFELRIDATSGDVVGRTDWVVHEPTSFIEIQDDGVGNGVVGVETDGVIATERSTRAVAPAPAAAVAGSVLNAPNKAGTPPGTYSVFALPKESPYDGARTDETNPADGQASPFGWHDTNGVDGPESTLTQGNNAQAYTDVASPGGIDAGELQVDGGPSLIFTPALDLDTQQPTDYRPAAVVNLFYWNNIMHDVLWHYGFDEASGNFQINTYGRGGAGGDDVRAEAQDFSGTNNANFSTPPDGSRPRMQMYVWNGPGIFTVNTPANIAGTSTGGTAGEFGAQTFDLTADVVVGLDPADTAGPSTTDGCGALTNVAAVTGKIALVDRGTCGFAVKAKNVQNAGAVGIVINNNVTGPPAGLGGADATVTIPVLLIRKNIGDAIKAELANAVTVNVRMQRGSSVINRDSDLDNGVIAHEYGHGVSNRLVGGPANVGCLGNTEQMGEGWSDLYALFLTTVPGDTRTTRRAIGTYVAFQDPNTDPGIRLFPYTTDLAVNPMTYDYLKLPNATLSAPHGIGTVWASMVWEVYWNLVDRYGYDNNKYTGTGGNNLAMRLVTEGLKYTRCSPTFTDGRDGILAADLALNNGANQCQIWQGFAKRGLGFRAQANDRNNRNDGVQAFDLPPLCTVNVQPAVLDICAPDDAVYTVNIGELAAAAPYNLDLQGEPTGTTVNFTTNPLARPATSTLTVGNTGAATPGRYAMNLVGTNTVSATNVFTSPITLNLNNAVPAAAAILTPTNGSTSVPIRPIFNWTLGAQTLDAAFELASDAAFSTVVYSTTARDLTQAVTPRTLTPGTTYYARVRSSNACGSTTSAVSSFTVKLPERTLLVDDENNDPNVQAGYVATLTALGVPFDLWDTVALGAEPDAAALSYYKNVFWFSGATGFPSGESDAPLTQFLNNGGCYMVSAQEYFARRDLTAFAQTYLGLSSATDDRAAQTGLAVAGQGSVFGGVPASTLTFPAGYSNFTDELVPDSSAEIAFRATAPGSIAGISTAINKTGSTYRTVYMGFALDRLPAATIQEVMKRVINYCAFQSDLTLTKAGPTDSVTPGENIAYALRFANTGTLTATGVVITDTLSSLLTTVAYTSSGATVTPVAGPNYRFTVSDLAPGASGIITITGVISPVLNADTQFINAASIGATTLEPNKTNNSAVTTTNIVVPQVKFNSATATVNESDGQVSITAVLNQQSGGLVDAVYTVNPGTALQGSDYTVPEDGGAVQFPAGTITVTFSINIVNDAVVEPNETFTLTFTSVSGGRIVEPSTLTVTIVDNDPEAGANKVYLPFVAR